MGILSREDLSHELRARAAQSYRPIIFDLQVRQLLSQLQRTHHHQFHGFPTSHLPPEPMGSAKRTGSVETAQ